MLGLPLKYNFRNLWVRKVYTILTMSGISLVVATFLCMSAMTQGLEKIFTSSGSDQNILLLRRNSQSELSSLIERDVVMLVKSLPFIDLDQNNEPLLSEEVITILNLDKVDGGQANVTLRGVGPKGHLLRNSFRIVQGQMFKPSMNEAMVSVGISKRFKNCALGETIRFGSVSWKVVGVFTTDGQAADSEIWTDVEGLQNDFKRTLYSSVLVSISNTSFHDAFHDEIKKDARMAFDVKTEKLYYDEQIQTSKPIKILGSLVALIMAVGACFGAMNTMYSAVSNRTREIATLRALGFSKTSILISFIIESLSLSVIGGLFGLFLGWIAVKLAFSGVTGTINFTTFSEMIFAFRLTNMLYIKGFVFSLLIGFFGGLFPAIRAIRTPIIQALRHVG